VLKVATIYPELLGTYGDGGNALVVVQRARERHYEAELLEVRLGEDLPDADIYVLGGGEDGPQRQATDALRRDGSLADRHGEGAVIFAVCAGLQILGTSFEVEGGNSYQGVGLVELETRRGEKRRVGNFRSDVAGRALVGFENHGGVSTLGEVGTLGQVRVGFGNDGHGDGFRAPRLFGTYAHGPVLAINPWLADAVLAEALGTVLEPLRTVADQLYEARLAKVN
jgi:CobQ-like glutamine amidotransferase family enzyme